MSTALEHDITTSYYLLEVSYLLLFQLKEIFTAPIFQFLLTLVVPGKRLEIKLPRYVKRHVNMSQS